MKPPPADEVRVRMTPVSGDDPFVTVIVSVDTCPGFKLVTLGNIVAFSVGAIAPKAYTL